MLCRTNFSRFSSEEVAIEKDLVYSRSFLVPDMQGNRGYLYHHKPLQRSGMETKTPAIPNKGMGRFCETRRTKKATCVFLFHHGKISFRQLSVDITKVKKIQSYLFSTFKYASPGISTLPTPMAIIFALPFFCFCRSFNLRV